MQNEDAEINIIKYHKLGMHPNEIAARLLLDVPKVKSVISTYENEAKQIIDSIENYDFMFSELKEGIKSMRANLEVLFEERKFEYYNLAYGNWIKALNLYLETMKQKEGINKE